MANLLEKIKFDSEGVPVLSAEEIDAIAENIVCEFNAEFMYKAKMIPVMDVLQRLMRKHELKFDAVTLPETVLGYLNIKEYEICLNSMILPPQDTSNRWRFVLAHELGHFFLHSFLGNILMQDTEAMFRILSPPPRNQITDWVEWQANTFAGAFLLPQTAFKIFMTNRLAEYNFRVNPGQFYLDDQPVNKRNIIETIDCISQTFSVSKHVAKIRLDRLGYIKYADKQSMNSQSNVVDVSRLSWGDLSTFMSGEE